MGNSWELLRKRLLLLRDHHGAVAEFCRKTGLNRQTVENWLDGKSAAGIENLDRIAGALGREPWQLLAPTGTPGAGVPPDILEALARALSDPKNEEFIRRWLEIANKT